MAPIVAALHPYCQKYQIANEPNHVARYEGWGATDEDAQDFNRWFLEVYAGLKRVPLLGQHWLSRAGSWGDADHRESAWLRDLPSSHRARRLARRPLLLADVGLMGQAGC